MIVFSLHETCQWLIVYLHYVLNKVYPTWNDYSNLASQTNIYNFIICYKLVFVFFIVWTLDLYASLIYWQFYLSFR